MAFAIVSDIHANLEALHAVLADISRQGVSRIVCLGDVIGYGANPRESLEIAIDHFDFVIKGNHEDAIMFNPAFFNDKAAESAKWTRDQLNKQDENNLRDKFWNFLGELNEQQQEGDTLFVHATPNEPTNEYLMPKDIKKKNKMEKVFENVERVSFGGHTHIPGIFRKGEETFLRPEDVDHNYQLNQNKVHVNVGSVGQPRDRNTDACYVVVEDDEIHFQRVSYNVRKAAKKITEVDRLSDSLGKRLLVGK